METKHTHNYRKGKGSVDVCDCGRFRHNEKAGPAIVEQTAQTLVHKVAELNRDCIKLRSINDDLLAALKAIVENSRLLLSKSGAAGHRYSESEKQWIADPWTAAFETARAAILKAEGKE